MKVFLDASAIIALSIENDTNHQKAVSAWQKLIAKKVAFFTSDYVLDESFTRIRKIGGLEKIFKLYQSLKDMETTKKLTILWMDKEVFLRSFQIFADKSMPKTFSFTDATIAAQMKTHKLDLLFTFDRDFKSLKKPRLKVIP